jgi:hypothetical protein
MRRPCGNYVEGTRFFRQLSDYCKMYAILYTKPTETYFYNTLKYAGKASVRSSGFNIYIVYTIRRPTSYRRDTNIRRPTSYRRDTNIRKPTAYRRDTNIRKPTSYRRDTNIRRLPSYQRDTNIRRHIVPTRHKYTETHIVPTRHKYPYSDIILFFFNFLLWTKTAL